MAPARNILLEARDLVRDLGEAGSKTRVLHGVSLGIRRGELLALTGHSGSGKSTLLYLLGAIDRPDSGTVLFEDVDLGALDDDERAAFRGATLGFVFQFHFLLPEFSIAENVALPIGWVSLTTPTDGRASSPVDRLSGPRLPARPRTTPS